MVWDNTLIDLFFKGGFAMWPLLALSVLGVAILLDRCFILLWLHTNFAAFLHHFEPLLRAGKIDDARQQLSAIRSPLARLAEAYLANLDAPTLLRDQIVSRQGSQQVARLEQRMNWLAMNASVATLLGLLGTVTGLVTAFHQIEVKAGHVQPGDLASGIWEALITTVFGLIIAIPCLAFYHCLDSWASSMALQMQWLSSYLDEWLHKGAATEAAEVPDARPPERKLGTAVPSRS